MDKYKQLPKRPETDETDEFEQIDNDQDLAELDELADAPPQPISKDPLVQPERSQKFVLSVSNTEIYVSQPPNDPPASTSSTSHGLSAGTPTPRLLILLSNSLGLSSPNNLRLADQLSAKLNCLVIMPDLFGGDPLRTSKEVAAELHRSDPDSGLSLLEEIKTRAVGAVKGFMDEMWLAKHTFDRTYPHLCDAMTEIIEIFKPARIGVVGYSFGARYVFHMLQDHRHNEWVADDDLVVAGVAVHPSLVKATDFDCVAKPLYLIYHQHDSMFPQKLVDPGLAGLRSRAINVDTFTFDDPQIPHGFAVPGDYPEEIVRDWPDKILDEVSTWIGDKL